MSSNVENLSKQELLSTVNKQADQLKRYETRLRDVVTAYKGLIKQKEALETSLKALSRTKPGEDDSLAALTISLSTLTAEKSRMEEAFQADKKLALEKHEKEMSDLRDDMKNLILQHQAEVCNLRAKISYEIQEREKDHADHVAVIKEFHAKLNSERKTKERLEEKCLVSSDNQVSGSEMEKRVRDLSSELEAAQRKLQRAAARTVETPQMLVRLQEKMALLQQSHSVALREEQIKAKRAEETARKVCASQEERVALLESKLAELSHTVGEYDLQRRKDQQLIQQLKDNLNSQILDKTVGDLEGTAYGDTSQQSETDNEKLADSEYLQNLIDKIHILKQELIRENSKLGNAIDVSTIFTLAPNEETLHSSCREEIERLRMQFSIYKRQLLENNMHQTSTEVREEEDKVDSLKSQIKVLQERVVELNIQLQEETCDKEEFRKLEEKLSSEQSYHKDVTSELKTRILNLERLLQTQRDRYSALLEETDNYIRTRNDRSRKVSVEEGHFKDGALQDMTAPPHMLHYAHELARKDLDISQLRKDKHILEGQLRDSQRESTIEKERFKEVLRTLKSEIDRLRRTQSREGANLEYLKNVVLSYLLSSDYGGKKHMLNAIAAVLHFTDAEKNMVLSTI